MSASLGVARRHTRFACQILLLVLPFVLLTQAGCSRKTTPQANTELAKTPRQSVDEPIAQPTTEAVPQDAPKKKPVRRLISELDLKAIGTCAIVDFSRTPTGALFETRVIGTRKLTWVERAQVDKVVRELELQALFSPKGGSKRVGLGKLLRADVLVMLRAMEAADEKKTKVLEIVVCESQRGLRLATETVPLADKAEAEMQYLESVLDTALAKMAAKITDVCAVPVFLNNDLDYRFDYLKSAFARAVEQYLLQRKGVLLVELAEAQAIAKESILSGDDANIERRLPLFFLGAFRNDGKDENRRMTLKLTLRRGDKEVDNQQEEGVLPGDAFKSLEEMLDRLTTPNDAVAGEPAVIDIKAEFDQLVERARAHQRLGNWQESLDLLEAALLLDPTPRAVHEEACRACTMVIDQMSRQVHKNHALAEPMMQLFRRCIEHMEMEARTIFRILSPIYPKKTIVRLAEDTRYNARNSFSSIVSLRNLEPRTPERNQLLVEVITEYRQTMTRACRARALGGAADDHQFLACAVEYMPDSMMYPLIRNLIQEFKDLPNARKRTYSFAETGDRNNGYVKDAPFDAFLDELLADPHPEIRAGALDLKAHRDKNFASAKKPNNPAKAPEPGGQPDVVFQPLILNYGTIKSTGKPAILSLTRCLPLAGDVDVFVANHGLFLMKEKRTGKLVMSDGTRGHCYDGRFVWFYVAKNTATPRLFVLDPTTEKVVEILENDGLPAASPESLPDKQTFQKIGMAPLGPGKILIAGYFGKSWLAVATFDPREGRKDVKVFHEAHEDARAKVKDQWTRNTIAFEPEFMHVIGSEPGRRRVLVGRGCTDNDVECHPLVVDPDNLKVEVMKDWISIQALAAGCVHESAAYYSGDMRKLIKIAYPGHKKQYVMKDVPQGRLVLHGDEMYVVDAKSSLWYGSLSKKEIRRVGEMPKGNLNFLGVSNHYGMMATTWDPEERYKIYRVLISPKAKVADK